MSRADMRAHAAVLAGCVLLCGCVVGPDYKAPDTEVADRFDAESLLTGTGAGEVEREWWRQFNDPLLDELVDAAVTNNRDVAAATARLREARAQRRERELDVLPSITGSVSYDNVRQSARGSPGIPAGTPINRSYELFDAGFDAGWEIDLFGRLRRLKESATAAAAAAEAARNQVVLSVIAEVARNYFELRGAQSQLAVARSNAGNQSRALTLVNERLEAGRGTALDTARATAQVETTLASVPPLEAAVDRAMRRIAVLTGAQPGALGARLAAARDLPTLPASIALGNPESLLRRRPDIRVAERQLASATAEIGVRVADLFPRLTIDAGIGLAAPTLSGLTDSGNDRRSIGPMLTWGVLDFAQVRQRIRAADARSVERLASYEQTVLLALEETENALSDFARERRRLEHLARAAEASRSAADLAAQRFEGGVSDFLTALDAYRTSLEAEDLLAISRTRTATALIAIYKALGGGWEIAPPDGQR